MKTNDYGLNFVRILLLKFYTVLLAVLVFVFGLTDANTVMAASPYTPGKLVGTYKLTSASSVKEKGGTLHYRQVMTVSEGGNGTIVITNGSNQKWQGVIDQNTGKGACKLPVINKSGKVVGTTNVEVRFKHLGGGNYSLTVLGVITYQKKGAGTAGPASSSTTKKEKTQKTETTKQNNTAKQNTNDKNDRKQTVDKNKSGSKSNDNQTADKEKSDTDEEEHDDLPESDAGKAALAVGTALAGAMAGAVGAIGGTLGGAAGGGAGGVAGSVGSGYDGYGPDEGGYGPDEGGYGPDEGDNDPGADNDYDESGEDYDESGEDYDESGEDQDESGEDYDESGEDQDESGEDTDDDRDDNRDDYDQAGDDQDNVSEDYDDDRNDYDDDYDRTEKDYDNASDDYENVNNAQGDGTEAEDKPETSDVAQDESARDIPDNLSVEDDGSIRITLPTGQEMVYTRNEDGTYNIPTQTETGEDLTYQDEEGNRYPVQPGLLSQEEVLGDAQWFKDHEQEMLADRAAEDARQQALRDIEAEKDRVWLEKERAINSQLSRTSIETQEALRQLENKFKKDDLIYDMRWQYAHGDESISVDDLKKLMKKEQLKNRIEGGYHDKDAADWDDRIVTAQEIKFVADQSVNAYSTLTHNQAFANMYSAATNYGETTMDAIVNKKPLDKALLKATIDTGLDMTANKFEDHGWHITGNAFAGAYKQVNDNLYNGRDAWEGTDEAAIHGGAMGAVNKGIGKLNEMSQGTVLGREIGGTGGKPKLNTDIEIGGSKPKLNTDAEVPKTKLNTDAEVPKTKLNTDAEASKTKLNTDTDASKTKVSSDTETGSTKPKTSGDGETGSSTKPRTSEAETGTSKPKTSGDAETGSSTKPRTGDAESGSSTKPKTSEAETGTSKPKANVGTEPKKTTIAERRAGQGEYKNQTPTSEASTKAQINEDVQANRAMNEVRKLNKISQKMKSMETANPKTYQNDPEYQKLSQEFNDQSRTVRENKLSVDRMNALGGETGTELRQRYNKSDMEYEKKVLQYRNESIAAEKGLKPSEIGDTNVTSNKDSLKAAGGSASHDTDTSPYVKVSTGTGKNAKVDFSQVDGDHHLARAIYKAEHGRYPQTAAEYDEALRLKQVRDFTNVSTRPSDTHELHHNPDAYVGSGKGEVGRVLEPEKFGTPEKGTGVFNEQTAIHKQSTPLERHQQQYAEAQKLREQLKTDTNLSASEKTAMGKKIADLEYQSASNHYESVRTTAKEFNVINKINDVNIKNGLGDGLSSDAKQIGKWANQVAKGEMDAGTYKKLVTEKYGSEENALKIVANGFRTTNK